MMDAAKAIEKLKTQIKWGVSIETEEAINAGIMALRKHIPRKPVKTILHFDGNYVKCPICENLLSEEHNYCDECGQKLIWDSQQNRSGENGKIRRIEED